jgi:hypothetical protein
MIKKQADIGLDRSLFCFSPHYIKDERNPVPFEPVEAVMRVN